MEEVEQSRVGCLENTGERVYISAGRAMYALCYTIRTLVAYICSGLAGWFN